MITEKNNTVGKTGAKNIDILLFYSVARVLNIISDIFYNNDIIIIIIIMSLCFQCSFE